MTSYPGLVDRVARLAAGLERRGLRRGDRVVLLLPNAPEPVDALWASFWGGFGAVPPSTGVRFESVLDTAPAEMVPAGDDDAAWLFYTSGTTGRPKGATLTHRNLVAMTRSYYDDLDPVAPGSVYLHAAPLTHGSGLYLLPATGRGATNVIAPGLRFSPADYLELVGTHRVTHAAFLAPTMLTRLVAAAAAGTPDLSTRRSVVVGAPLYQEDLRRAVGVLGPIVVQIYGQGESPRPITVMPADLAMHRPGHNRVTAVWVAEADRWRLVAFHSTPVPG